MINILVTAVGSELASSVIKAIRIMQTPFRLIGCDIYQEVVGKYWCDTFYVVPNAHDEEAYIDVIRKIIKEEKVDFIIPTADSEYFILPHYKRELLEMYGCTLLTNNLTEVELYNDKWLAYKYYISNSIPSPRCYLLQGLKNIQSNLIQSCFPLIIKPRSGGGSRSIYKIETFDEIRKYTEIVPNPILSEYLLPDDEEYTAGTYRTTQNIVYVIIIKRKLKFGMTNSGHVVTDSVLEEFCRDIILKTKLRGANNIQFRLTSEGPKVLEINPRFSGTTGIRANYGFNEIEMWINESIGCTLEQPILKKGSFMRYMEEQYQFVDK